jgi:hypothetical protein
MYATVVSLAFPVEKFRDSSPFLSCLMRLLLHQLFQINFFFVPLASPRAIPCGYQLPGQRLSAVNRYQKKRFHTRIADTTASLKLLLPAMDDHRPRACRRIHG